MARTIIGGLIAPVLLLIFCIPSFVGKALSKRNPYAPIPGFVKSVVRFLAGLIALVGGIKIEVKGKENLPRETVLFAANHQGYLDILPVLLSLGGLYGIVAKKEIARLPFVEPWMTSFGCIFLDRGNLRAELSSLEKVRKQLENGRSMVIFPEGTRSKGPGMGSFKAGALRPAVKAGVKVVPLAIDGSYKRLEEKGRFNPGLIKLSVLPAVSSKGKKTAELSEEIEKEIEKELENMRRDA